MSEELHEITFQTTARISRSRIQEVVDENDGSPDFVLACREWLANNPEGMTREQFNQLPDGSVVQLKSGEQFRVQDGRLWSVVWTPMIDNNLDGMSVVSTPPAPTPTLDSVDVVRDRNGYIWELDDAKQWWVSHELCVYLPISTLRDEHGPLTPMVPGPQV